MAGVALSHIVLTPCSQAEPRLWKEGPFLAPQVAASPGDFSHSGPLCWGPCIQAKFHRLSPIWGSGAFKMRNYYCRKLPGTCLSSGSCQPHFCGSGEPVWSY